MKEVDRDEIRQLIREGIENNFCCTGEDGARSLEYQLDRIEKQQHYLKDYINDSLTPAIKEIRDALRATGNEHGTH